MNEFVIRIAAHTVAIAANYESTRNYCRDYLCNDEAHFHIHISQKDIEFERQKSMQEDTLEGKAPRSFSDAYLETIAVQRKLAEHLFAYDTLLFHGSVVAVDNEAYLFTAKSGTGKSTHTRLWREVFGSRAVMVNDDKPFLKITKEGILVYGSPWNGKHGLGTNICVPLKAICILGRGEENEIHQIPAKDAVFMLLQQSNRPMNPGLMPKYMELIDRLAQDVDFYEMHCNMNPEAAVVSYETMSGKRKEDVK